MPLIKSQLEAGECPTGYGGYVDLVPDGDVLDLLDSQIYDTVAALQGAGEEVGAQRYAPDKWSVKEVVGHLIDVERVFAYRALVFSRGDAGPLPGFEQDDYVRAAGFDRRPLADLMTEFQAVRRATSALFRSFTAGMWLARGVANDVEITVRAIAFILAGHERHHLRILRERYLKG